MKVQNHNRELLAVPLGSIQFLVAVLIEKAAIIEAGQGVRGRVDLQLLEIVVFDQDGNTKKACGSENIYQSGFERNSFSPRCRSARGGEQGSGPSIHCSGLPLNRSEQWYEKIGVGIARVLLHRVLRGSQREVQETSLRPMASAGQVRRDEASMDSEQSQFKRKLTGVRGLESYCKAYSICPKGARRWTPV